MLGMKTLHFSDNVFHKGNFFLYLLIGQFAQSLFDSYGPLERKVLLTKPVLHSLTSLFTVYQLICFSQIFTNFCRGDQTCQISPIQVCHYFPIRLLMFCFLVLIYFVVMQSIHAGDAVLSFNKARVKITFET